MLTLGAPRLPTDEPYFWVEIAARAVEVMTPRVRSDLAYSLKNGGIGLRPMTLRDVAEEVIRTAMPALDCPCCRAECVLSIIALDLSRAAQRAWRAALLSELETCRGR